jgi:hypothetical protein
MPQDALGTLVSGIELAQQGIGNTLGGEILDRSQDHM